MNAPRLSRLRVQATVGIALAVWALLAWDHVHGGIPSHSFMARADMPAISNAWGGLLLPVLAWFLTGRIERRIAGRAHGHADRAKQLRIALAGFVGALAFGVLLAVFFTRGQESATSNMALSLLPLALLFPIYRAEYVLGFVLGMAYTFGAMLPTGFACVVALMAAVLYRGVRPLLLRTVRWITGRRVAATGSSAG